MSDSNKRKVAVALKYDKDTDDAPKVVAKGYGQVAENIVKKGKEEGVDSVGNEALATELVKLEINDEIPEELYTAVAEILSYVYRLDSERSRNV